MTTKLESRARSLPSTTDSRSRSLAQDLRRRGWQANLRAAQARAGALACYLESRIHGVSVQGRNGSPRADLEELIETAISAFQRTG